MQYFTFSFSFGHLLHLQKIHSELYTGMEPMSISKKELKISHWTKVTWENGETVVILLYPSASPQMTFLWPY